MNHCIDCKYWKPLNKSDSIFANPGKCKLTWDELESEGAENEFLDDLTMSPYYSCSKFEEKEE